MFGDKRTKRSHVAKNGSASKRQAKPRLRQTRLTDLSKVVSSRKGSTCASRDAAEGGSSFGSTAHDELLSTGLDGASDSVEDGDDNALTFATENGLDKARVPDQGGTPASQQDSTSITVATNPTALPPKDKTRRHYQQSKIKLVPGVSRFISTDPMDSEEEEFRATQIAPQGIQAGPLPSPKRRMRSDSESGSEAQQSPSTMTPGRSAVRKIPLDDSDEEELVTPLKRRKRFMPPVPAPESSSDSSEYPKYSSQDQELAKEARDLDDGLSRPLEDRQRNVQKSAYRSNLEKLRRKKAGLAFDSDESDDVDDVDEDDETGDEELTDPASNSIEPAPEDWIIDDELDRQQIIENMPEEFQQPRQPLEQFKIAVQWEILDLLVPQGGLEPDHYFKPAIDWLRGRTAGKSQAAISSIWRRPFVRALQRGPELNALQTGNLGYFCDACGRTNRVATYIVKFEGPRYDHMTLEDLDTDADSSEDDLLVDENAASDVEEEKERKERTLRAEWNLGINCYERTCVAHELFHLRKQLREELHDKLRHMGLFSATKILERATLSTGKRLELANSVTEQLDGVRFQQRLWTRYKASIEKNENYIVDPNVGRRKGRFGH